MRYKALFLDLDDTTVLQGKTTLPSRRVTEAIAKAKEKIHICIATARPLSETLHIFDHLDITGPSVINNGTQIYDPVNTTVLREIPLPQPVLKTIAYLCRRHALPIYFYDGNQDQEGGKENVPEKALSIFIPQIPPADIDFYVKVFSVDNTINVQKIPAWDKRFMAIHIAHSEASKLHGIVEVSRMLQITSDEIIGVGDGYNDFPLLMACGLKIAMGNAVPELKEIADFVVPSVHEDGVATVIDRFVLQ